MWLRLNFATYLIIMQFVINYASLNINCLRSQPKQQLLKQFIYNNDLDILLLQEVNIENFNFIGPQYNSIVNVGDANRGTAIIYRSGLSIQLYEQHQSGRITSLLLNTGALIVNLYLPSGSNNRLLREQMIVQDLPYYLRHKYNTLILGGDFNNVLNAKDQKGEYHPSPNLQRLCNELQLLDAWEVVHGNNVQFTFHRGQAASRLDRIYVNKQLKDNILNAQVQPAVFSDHHALLVKIKVDNTIPPHGRGYWKLNESLLYDDKIKEEFMLRWKAADTRANNRTLTHIQKWLTLYKPAIRSFFKYVGIVKARERKNLSEFYYRLLQELLMKQRAGQDVDAEIKNIKTKIVQIQEYIMDGIKIRSRTTSVADDERGALYHLASEKSKGSNKYIHSLTSGDDGLITSTKDIMHQAEIHFTQLFDTKQINIYEQDKILDYVTSSLSDEEASSLTQPITSEEILLALKTASTKSAPGPDGIGYNFYKIYWNIIKEPLTKLFNELLHTTEHPMGFNEGIIILIPKLSQAKTIQDYRPITLLNTDFKLFAKLIANRIRFHLKDLIGEEQTCGIPGRKITDNLEALRDTIFYFDKNRHESAGLLSLDFQKAFDNINHQYLFKTMNRMNIPEMIINVIRFMYSDAHSRIQVNGFFTKPIRLASGIRQGCPLSMLLYSICTEPLIRMIHQNLHAEFCNKKLFTTLAYADDMVILLRKEQQLITLRQVLNRYAMASTANINFRKSNLLPLGQWPPSLTMANIPIKDVVKILGMFIHRDIEKMIELNWNPILNTIRYMFSKQLTRNLNLIQKIWNINLFILSKVWYIAQIIPLPEDVAQRIELGITYYLWTGHIYKVAKSQLWKRTEQGGCGLIAVNNKSKALLIKTLLQRKIKDKNSSTSELIDFTLQHPIFRRIKMCLNKIPERLLNDPESMTTKEIYTSLLDVKETIPSIMKKYPNMNWKRIWKIFTQPNISTDWKTSAYKVVNDIVPTEAKKYHHNITHSPLCQQCGSFDTLHHRLTTCRPVVWSWLCRKLIKASHTDNPNDVLRMVLQLEIPTHSNKFALTWIIMGYLHYMISDTNPTIAGLQKLLMEAERKLRRRGRNNLLVIDNQRNILSI